MEVQSGLIPGRSVRRLVLDLVRGVVSLCAVLFFTLSLLGPSPGLAAELIRSQLWVTKPPACDEAIANPPAPVTAFVTTDPEFYLWFAVRDARQGDVAASEYYTPGGQLYAPASGPWNPLDRAGTYCFTDLAFRIAGAAPATMPGNWRVLIKWNSQTLAEIRFTISPPGNTGPAPTLATGGVVNTADYTAALAPGAMISLFGTNLAAATRQAAGAPLPTTLDGVSVEVADGGRTLQAPLFFVSAGQINAQLPFGLQSASVSVRVRNARGDSQAVTAPVRARAPRLFTRTQDGKGEAILLHAADYGLVSRERPALPNEYLVLYLTGLGAVTPEATAGRPGGDGGASGTLQRVTDTVTATMGGRDAVVHFAGLAPGFMGLYQVNLQAPAGLAEGAHAVVIRCGGQASQSGVTAWVGPPAGGKPEDVVRAALEAQARGDVAGLLSHAAQEGYSEAGKQAAVKIFETVRRNATFSDFQFTHLATAPGDKVTVVRGLVSAAVATHQGRFPMTRGVLAYLRKENGVWRIVTLGPDELLNQELYESGAFAKLAGAGRAANVVDLGRLNDTITEALKKGHIDEARLTLDVFFASVGRVPVYGDAAAQVYQFIDTGSNAWATVQEVWANGWGPIGLIKVKQVGAGILQIVTEPIPGVDTQADLIQASLEQLGHNLEVARALNEVRATVRKLELAEVKVNPRFYQGAAVLFSNPAGVEVEAESNNPVRYSYGTPVGQIRLTAPAVLDQTISLQVAGEIAFDADSPAVPLIRIVGGEARGNLYYLPVDVTYLVEKDVSEFDAVLDGYDRFRSPDSMSGVVRWVATCRRGLQELRVRLRNGESTQRVLVRNDFMNEIDRFQIQGISASPIGLRVGQSLSGLRVSGASSRLEQRFWPDLTGRRECLDMAIAEPRVAELTRGATVTLTGRSAGQTRWDLLLGGSALGPGWPEVRGSVDIKVEGEDKLSQIHPTIGVVADVIGEHYVSSGTQPRRFTEDGNSFRTPTLRFGACTAKTVWNEASFDFSGTCPTSGGDTVEFSMKGQVGPDLARIETGIFRAKTTTRSGLQWTEISYNVNDLEAAGFRDGGSGCTIFDFRAYREKARNHVSNIRFTRVYLAADGSERQRDTYARTEWDRTDAVVPEVRVSFVCRLP